MAESYQIPPWIRAPDIAAEYQRGVAIGQQAAQEQQRLQMQQEENQRAHLMEQQRLMVEKAYKDQELSMRKQELDQAAQLNAIKVQEAARKIDANNKYQQYLLSGGPGGTPGDPAEGFLRYGLQMGETPANYATLIKQYAESKHPFIPRTVMEGGTKFAETSRGHYRVVNPPKATPSELEKFDVTDEKARLRKATTDLETVDIGDPDIWKDPAKIQDWQRKRKLVDMLRNKLASKPSAPQDLEAVTKRAHAAIAAGADEAKVKARYKQVTGQELDTGADTTDDEEE